MAEGQNSGKMIGWRQGLLSLSPVILFLLIYLVVSIAIGDFYKMPFSVALLIASVWSVIIYRGHPIADRIEVFSKAAGHSNIIYMIWILSSPARTPPSPRRSGRLMLRWLSRCGFSRAS